MILKDFRQGWHQVPKGIWVMLLTYTMVSFGSPMPGKITLLEVFMGCGLLMGGITLSGLVMREIGNNKSSKLCLSLIFLLFFFPFCVGVFHQNSLSAITRDVFPLAFLVIFPFVITYSISSVNRVIVRTAIVCALLFVGIWTAGSFYWAAHAFLGSADQIMSMVSVYFSPADMLQGTQLSSQEFNDSQREIIVKSFDPAMLFSAIFLSSWGVILMVRSWHEYLLGLVIFGVGIIISYGFMLLGLRAFVVFFVSAVFAICLTQLRERGLYFRVLPVLLMAIVVLWPQIASVLHLLWAKQQAVGMNGKSAEWLSVISIICTNLQTMLFGIGWGGTLENPIVGEATRFTHSLLSFYMLKSGVIGLSVLLAIIALLLHKFKKEAEDDQLDISRLILFFASMPPLLIGVLFEPTYKMLSYGVIFTLLVFSRISIKSKWNGSV